MSRSRSASFFLPSRRRTLTLLSLSFLAHLGTTTPLRAQLTWGVNGAGGTGTWDTTTANWYNGTSNVAWDNSSATFAGTAGTVTAVNNLSVQAMTFNVAGYTVTGGPLYAPTNLTVTTNTDATLASTTGSNNTSSGIFVKNGSGTLTYTGTNFFDTVQINAGNYVATTNSGSFFSAFNLANVAGAALTFGGTTTNADLDGLSGGGTAGGVVQPGTQGGTVVVTNFDGGTFAGVLQDSANTRLAYRQFGGSTAQTFSGANTYSGATTLTAGALTFAGNGTALNTASLAVASGTKLTLDNSATAVGNRLADSLPVALSGGQIVLVGNASTAVTETLGTLTYSGASTVTSTASGSTAATLNFAGTSRAAGATLNVSGTGGVVLGGVSNGSNGIVAPYVTVGNEWAVVGPSGGTIQPFANYATNPATAGANDHVKLSAASTALPSGTTTATWNTLNLQNAATSTQTLDLGAGHTLALAGGGLLASGSGPAAITNGTLAAGGELVVTNHNALTIGSTLVETSAGTALTKSGEGTLTLSGNNAYSGTTSITQGTLAVSSDANLGTGTTVSFGNGTLQANASFSTAKNLVLTTSQVATINTNGNNVTVTGTSAGVSKVGAGVLTLTSGATGSNFVSAGTLVLPNATSGLTSLSGGTLQAAGTLTQLNLNGSATLNVGGPGAQSLTLGSYGSGSGTGAVLTVRFTLGSTAQDQLTISQRATFPLNNQSILFTIDYLGTVQTGVSYTLLNLPGGSSGYTVSTFGLSPESTAAGYQGTFTVGTNAVTVSFSAVPEPAVCTLLALGGSLLLGAGLRRRHHPRGGG